MWGSEDSRGIAPVPHGAPANLENRDSAIHTVTVTQICSFICMPSVSTAMMWGKGM